MDTIKVDASKPQLTKLRKGLKVNLKSGEGVHIHILPSVAKHFNKKGKGSIQLSPELLDANKNSTTIPEGKGIFKNIKRFIEKNKDVINKVVKIAKPHAKRLLKKGVDALTPIVSNSTHEGVGQVFNQVSKHLVDSAIGDGLYAEGGIQGHGLTACLGDGIPLPHYDHIQTAYPACPLDKSGTGFKKGGALYAQSMEGGSIGLGGTILHIHHPALHPNPLDCRFRTRHFV